MNLIPIKEAAKLAGKSGATIRRWVKEGELKRHDEVAPVGNRPKILVDQDELRDLLGLPKQRQKPQGSKDNPDGVALVLIDWAQFIQDLRAKLGWTQGQLATSIASTTRSISRWERGEGAPGPAMKARLKRVAGGKLWGSESRIEEGELEAAIKAVRDLLSALGVESITIKARGGNDEPLVPETDPALDMAIRAFESNLLKYSGRTKAAYLKKREGKGKKGKDV